MTAAVAIAGLANVPVDEMHMLDWICGRSLPPRHSEGLNDPLSVASIMHFSLLADEIGEDPVARSTLNTLRTLLDDRGDATLWGGDDLVRFGSAFRQARKRMAEPYLAPNLFAVAERLMAVHAELEVSPIGGRSVSTIDGRKLIVEPRSFGTVWLLACQLPRALQVAGITLQAIPSLVQLPKFLSGSAAELAASLEEMIGRAAAKGLSDLVRLEALVAAFPAELGVTRRSKLPILMRLEAAYPGLRVPAIARLLGISPQGAAKLASQAKEVRHGRH